MRNFFNVYNFRRCIQLLFFSLFIYLLLKTTYPLEIYLPPDLFVRINPLIFIFTIISTGEFVFNLFIYSLPILILTILFGRIFCSFICPLGTLLDIIKLRSSSSAQIFSKSIKLYLFLFLLLTAIFQVPLFYFFEPITILIRTLTCFIERLFLPANLFIISIFLIIILLNIINRRFFCNYLCPVGTALGLLSKFTILRKVIDEKRCTNCNICIDNCRMQALNDEKYCTYTECINCFECISKCKKAALSIQFKIGEYKKVRVDLERRRFIQSILYGVAFAIVANFVKLKNNFLLRPPNAVTEKEFVDLCIRCGKCIKVCSTGGLQMTFLEASIEGLFTPILVPRIGPCAVYCNSCSRVCPSGAIRPFKIEEKANIIIGKAQIDKKRCWVWHDNRYCFICMEVCPYGACYGEGMKVYVDSKKCTGCGLCENRCPVDGEAAIRVYKLT